MASLRLTALRFPNPALVLMASAILAAWRAPTNADDTLFPEDALVTVHLAPFQSLYEAPLVQQIWDRLQTSRALQEAMQTVEAQQLQEAVAFLERQLGRSWQEIYASLSAGGVDIAVQADGKPQLLVIAHTADERFAADIVDLAVQLAQADGGAVSSGAHRGFTGYRIGNAAIAAVGRRLLIGSDPDLLKSTVDRILDAPPPASDRVREPFQISVRLNLDRFRSLPDVAEGLQFPADDAGAVVLLGGWMDLLLRHRTASLDVRLEHDRIDAVVRFAGTAAPPQFAGFWADQPGESSAPLLKLPGTIYSTSWYRDYDALWQSREQLVTAKVVEQMETADSEAAAQFEALGSAVSLSEVVRQFGPRFRIVVAQQTATPYEVELRNQLPAAALVIELKNEDAFREIADPLARVLHLILSFEQKITSQSLEHAGATLQQLSIPHTQKDVARRDQAAYNFRPTHCITRGHFIVGSTPQIVRQTIDALDAQTTGGASPQETGITSQQFVDVGQLAAALDRIRDAVIRQSVLSRGLDVDVAEHEFDVLRSLLKLFDVKTISGRFTEEGFQYRLRVTTP